MHSLFQVSGLLGKNLFGGKHRLQDIPRALQHFA